MLAIHVARWRSIPKTGPCLPSLTITILPDPPQGPDFQRIFRYKTIQQTRFNPGKITLAVC